MEDDKNTVLILAGDLWEGSKWIVHGNDSWIANVAPHFKQVLVIAGNHCLWPSGGLKVFNYADKCNALLQDHGLFNVLVLDQTTWQHEDVIFVGCTLWTDMNKCDPLTMMTVKQFMNQDGKIVYDHMPDGSGIRRFTPEKWIALHYKHKKFIHDVASTNPDKKIVVITHHIPMTTLGDPRYAGDPTNGYYSSDCSDVILDNENIKVWAYGHSHFSVDRMMVNCRLINNSIGYIGEHRLHTGECDEYKIVEV
jgi:hypothetical protein